MLISLLNKGKKRKKKTPIQNLINCFLQLIARLEIEKSVMRLAAAATLFSAEWPLTLVGVVLHLELQLLPLQLQEVHLDLQVLLLRLQRILELDEFLVWGGWGGRKRKVSRADCRPQTGRSSRQLSTRRLRHPACCPLLQPQVM